MKRTWSVFIGPYLVATVVPSISGSRSRCTPSRLTEPPRTSRHRDLVDLVEEDDAVGLGIGERGAVDVVAVEALVALLLDQLGPTRRRR